MDGVYFVLKSILKVFTKFAMSLNKLSYFEETYILDILCKQNIFQNKEILVKLHVLSFNPINPQRDLLEC